MFKYGTQLSSLGRLPRPEALAYGKTLGCQGLEVDLPVAALRTGGTTKEALLAEARALHADFAAAGMDVISLSPGLLLQDVQNPEIIQANCEVAQALGASTIRLFFAPHVRWGGPNSQLDAWHADFDGSHDSRYWLERNARELRQMVDMSAGFGLRYAFELHHGYVINSASAAMRIFDQFAPSEVGALMDPGNMVFEGNEGWRNSVQIMGEYLSYIHCKNGIWTRQDGKWVGSWDSLRDGIARFPEIITALQDEDWSGYLSIEDLRGGDLTVEEKVGGGIAYLQSLVASDERAMPS
ncbi:MAG TPA: sugar phosphate isomerase/epimerase [Armatimonadota bacterium]|jgi:sugar phosphate isomerase/epimerase